MSTSIDPTEHTVSGPNVTYHPDTPASDKREPSEPHTRLRDSTSAIFEADKKNEKRYNPIWDQVSHLWSYDGSWTYAHEHRLSHLRILKEWRESGQQDKRFLEKAVSLLIEFQRRPMKSMKNCLEWSDFLKESDIDSERYLSWVQKQYELLASAKSKSFEDLSLHSFRDTLTAANWQEANNESAKVNAYLMKAKSSGKPEISFGSTHGWPLALWVHGRCLKVPKADFSTAELRGVTVINPDVLLSIRFVPLGSNSHAQSFLFIPIGNKISSSQDHSLETNQLCQEIYSVWAIGYQIWTR
jgi:hypothetical protein